MDDYKGWTTQGIECEILKADCTRCSLSAYGISKDSIESKCHQPESNKYCKRFFRKPTLPTFKSAYLSRGGTQYGFSKSVARLNRFPIKQGVLSDSLHDRAKRWIKDGGLIDYFS